MANLSSHGKASPACLEELKHLKKSKDTGTVGKTALAKVMEQSYDYVGSSNIE